MGGTELADKCGFGVVAGGFAFLETEDMGAEDVDNTAAINDAEAAAAGFGAPAEVVGNSQL